MCKAHRAEKSLFSRNGFLSLLEQTRASSLVKLTRPYIDLLVAGVCVCVSDTSWTNKNSASVVFKSDGSSHVRMPRGSSLCQGKPSQSVWERERESSAHWWREGTWAFLDEMTSVSFNDSVKLKYCCCFYYAGENQCQMCQLKLHSWEHSNDVVEQKMDQRAALRLRGGCSFQAAI